MHPAVAIRYDNPLSIDWPGPRSDIPRIWESASPSHFRSSMPRAELPQPNQGRRGTSLFRRNVPVVFRPLKKEGRVTRPQSSLCLRRLLPLISFMSACMTLHAGRFSRNVAQLLESISNRASCSNPAFSSPRACPPPPAQSSTQIGANPAASVFLLDYTRLSRSIKQAIVIKCCLRTIAYSSNSFTSSETMRRAPVRAWTSSGVQPGATSRRTRPSAVRSMTARSVTIR